MVDDGKPFAVAAGQAVFVPTGAFHSTLNTGWEPLSLLAIYGPAGGEEAPRALPHFPEGAPGKTPRPGRPSSPKPSTFAEQKRHHASALAPPFHSLPPFACCFL